MKKIDTLVIAVCAAGVAAASLACARLPGPGGRQAATGSPTLAARATSTRTPTPAPTATPTPSPVPPTPTPTATATRFPLTQPISSANVGGLEVWGIIESDLLVGRLAIERDNEAIVVSDACMPCSAPGGSVSRLSLESGEVVRDHEGFAFSDDLGRVVTWQARPEGDRHDLALVAMETGEVTAAFGNYGPHVMNAFPFAVFDPKGEVLAYFDLFEWFFIDLYRIGTGRPLRVIEPATRLGPGTCNPTFSPDGRTIAAITIDYEGVPGLALWSVSGGAERRLLHEETHACFAFSPDGRWIAADRYGLEVQIVRSSGGAAVRTLTEEGPVDRVTSLAYSPDGRLLVVGRDDGRVEVWDPAGGVLLHDLTRRSDMVSALAFSPDGKLLAVGHAGGGIALWAVP